MPALPEIEVVRRDLEKEIVTRRVKSAEVRPGSNAMKVVKRHGRRKEFSSLLEGAKIESVQRRGMRLFFELDNGHVLVVDLGETAQLLKTSTSEEIAPHTHVIIEFTIGGQMRLVDPAKTASIFVISIDEFDSADEFRSPGIDPLDNGQPPTWPQFSSLLENKAMDLKEFLTDESIVTGLGDIYSDEVLFVAGIRHDRRTDHLSSQDVRRLYRALFETLQEAVKARGTTHDEDAFTDLAGNPGEYQGELKVYEREGQACPRCRSQIVKDKRKDGTTYFCPQCQT